MNCYNAEKYILDAIESLRNQTFKEWSLIVWDDASQDDTLKLVKKINDKRIRIFENNKHRGLGKGRISATRFLTGKYVSILDADDIFYNDKLEKQINILEKDESIGLVTSWFQIINEKKDILKNTKIKKERNQIIRDLYRENIFAHSSIIYRKKFAENVGWYSGKLEYAQDYDLTLKLVNKFNFHVIDKPLVKIRSISTNMSSSEKLKYVRVLEKIKILETNLEFNKNNLELKNILRETLKIENLKLLIIDFKKKSKISQVIKVLFFLIKNISINIYLIKLFYKKYIN